MTTASNPVSLDTLRERARIYLEGGQLPAAQATLETILRHAPNDLACSLQLADLQFQQGHLQASTLPLLRALNRLPKDAPLIVGLIQRLVGRGEIVAARACLDLLTQAPDPPAHVVLAQAKMRFLTGEFREALELAEKAVRAGMETPEAARLYGMLLQFNGRMDDACNVLEECLERWPDFGDAAPALVDMRKQTPDANYLDRLHERLQRLPEHPSDSGQAFARAEFEYALFKTLDDLGRYEEAWQALARCNALMSRLNPYSASLQEAVTDALIEASAVSGPATGRPPAFEGPVPIFIVGMPRSGTTLLDRILSSHSKVTSAGEIGDFWRQLHWVADVIPEQAEGLIRVTRRARETDCHQVGMRYLKQTQWRAEGRPYYVDKLPGNIQLVAFIRRALPHAPILHMVRDPMDTCFSNFKAMFGNVSAHTYELGAMAHYYGQYARLVRHWHETLPGAMLDVDYAELVRDSATVIPRVLAHCGLGVEEACLRPESNAAPVATRSTPQVRESIHTRGLGTWRHYDKQLAPLREALAAKS
ncbi:tetratricopeptide repeat-containing sulfotransferase family protein [Frateuria soli]|uniref:tetratricopeptide repeat-containing sulfotransferase family protein n=1 Tax=Frateuria soli TaxID=1542730 RepID=UPI001E35A8ED|nr:tetratricopeptide repeat-containing sulfotransferase family protein [Frateuria soli]UGB38150.1 sulfotransferase [Frateuria soli]